MTDSRSRTRRGAQHINADTGAVRINPMSPGDIPAVAALQLTHLDGSIVTQLGSTFLTHFHAHALNEGSTRAYVARDTDGSILGFVTASLDVDRFNRYVKPRVLLPLAWSLLSPRRVGLVLKIARALGEQEPQPHIPAELLLLVVDPRARRRGIGAGLLNAIEADFAGCGLSRYSVAVRSQLAVVRAFYMALGFEHEQDLTVLGEPMVYLTKRVAQGAADTGSAAREHTGTA